MKEKALIEVEKSFFEKNLEVKKSLFQADHENEIWLNDASRIIPYKISCFNCQKSHLTLEVTEASIKKWNYFYNTPPKIEIESVKELGGAGQWYTYMKCSCCDTKYYIGFRLIEPNNGRDVFVLHCIWEVQEIETID